MKPDTVWKLAPLLVAAVVGYFSGQLSAESRITRLETQVDERHQSLMQRITDVGERTRHGHNEIRMDLQGVRAEIMAILKEGR